MKVTREEIRKKVVATLTPQLLQLNKARIKYPLMPEVDVSIDKSIFVNIDLVYSDGWAAEIGGDANVRKSGTLVVEVNFKQGDIPAIKKANEILDAVEPVISNTDSLTPLRTFAAAQVSPTSGAVQGFLREALVVPFWYDSSK